MLLFVLAMLSVSAVLLFFSVYLAKKFLFAPEVGSCRILAPGHLAVCEVKAAVGACTVSPTVKQAEYRKLVYAAGPSGLYIGQSYTFFNSLHLLTDSNYKDFTMQVLMTSLGSSQIAGLGPRFPDNAAFEQSKFARIFIGCVEVRADKKSHHFFRMIPTVVCLVPIFKCEKGLFHGVVDYEGQHYQLQDDGQLPWGLEGDFVMESWSSYMGINVSDNSKTVPKSGKVNNVQVASTFLPYQN